MVLSKISFLNFLANQQPGDKQLIEQIVLYLNSVYELPKVFILKHKNAPEGYEYIDLELRQDKYYNIFSSGIMADLSTDGLLSVDGVYILTLNDHDEKIHYIVVIEDEKSQIAEIKPETWDEIRTIFKLAKINEISSRDCVLDKSVQIISRMSHDINSLIALIPEFNDQALNERINYTKQLSEKIMLYLRGQSSKPSWYTSRDIFDGILAEINKEEGINYKLNSEHESKYINADIELIEQALNAIIENAVVACSIAGSEIEISLRSKKGTSLFKEQNWLEVSVKDNGPGIPAEYISEVVKPLFTTWKDLGHIGLGLTLAENIVQEHGGTLLVKSVVGEGTNISFYIPLYDAKI